MKLSAYYKSLSNIVELKLDYNNLNDFDKVFISKVFTDTPIDNDVLSMPNVEYGGTGFYYDKAPPLPEEIEHMMPDYHLYDCWIFSCLSDALAKRLDDDEEESCRKRMTKEFTYYTDYSVGFTTRGCIRQCSFCVNKNYKQCNLHSSLSEFVDPNRKYICLLDDNILACKDWRRVFEDLKQTGKRFQFKQGVDERLLTQEKCEILFNSKWIGDFIFAFDNIEDKDVIEEKLKLIRAETSKNIKFYLFCGYNHSDPDTYSEAFWKQDIADLFERIKILMKYGCLPYIMRYKDYILSPYKGTYINLARWCNQPNLFKKKSYREFCEMNQGKSTKDCSTVRYLKQIESSYPEIAEMYFDIKYEEEKSTYCMS